MILVGNQRGGAKDLAMHLMKDENDYVTVHEVRGFASENLQDALHEAYAVSRGTKCKQFLFSLSLNPPKEAEVETTYFEDAIDRAEQNLGLNGQPRAIVFHEKDGRRHAHAVWSRIKVDEMKAVQLSFTKRKLQTLSRDLYLENGWKMPHGLANPTKSDPRNFTLAEWQQAKRINKDPREIKKAFQDAWAISDSKVAFQYALEEHGYRLARGDRRGFVGIDYRGEVFSIPRQAGVKTKQVRERLGDENDLPSVEAVQSQIAADMLTAVQRLQKELDAKEARRKEQFEAHRQKLVEKQRKDRESQEQGLAQRKFKETTERQARFRRGLRGLWDRLNGTHKQTQKRNEIEAQNAMRRDRREQDQLIQRQLRDRNRLNDMQVRDQKKRHSIKQELKRDKQAFAARASLLLPSQTPPLEAAKTARQNSRKSVGLRKRAAGQEDEAGQRPHAKSRVPFFWA